MKRFISILAAAMTLVAACAAFSSCNKTDKDALVGTTWVCSTDDSTASFNFLDGGKMTIATTTLGMTVSVEGTYTYEEPVVTIIVTIDEQTFTQTGTVSGDKLVFTEGSESMVFTRK